MGSETTAKRGKAAAFKVESDDTIAERLGITVEQLLRQRAKFEAHQKKVMSLLKVQEALHPDLLPYLHLPKERYLAAIKHPLMVCGYTHNAIHNYDYSILKSRAEKCRTAGDWVGWVNCHAEPYQMEALSGVVESLDDPTYWETVGDIFTSIENQHQYRAIVRRLLTSKRPCRERIMTEEEREVFATLPETITIYRGYGVARCRLGWSWTTEKAKAEWFARRFAALDRVKPTVITGIVAKRDVIAYFGRRNEAEVVCRPKAIKDVTNG